MLTLILLAGAAWAEGNEINGTIAWVGADNPQWHVFADAAVMPSGGIRLGYGLNEHITITAGWQHVAAAQGLYDASVDETDLDPELRFRGDQLLVGVKSGVNLFPGFSPYAGVQAGGMLAGVRIGDDLEDEDNAGRVKRAGATGGATAELGVDFPIDLGGSGLAIAPYVELGYGWFAPLKLDDLGKIPIHGFAGQAGAGLRF
jgi:hypothetical protein